MRGVDGGPPHLTMVFELSCSLLTSRDMAKADVGEGKGFPAFSAWSPSQPNARWYWSAGSTSGTRGVVEVLRKQGRAVKTVRSQRSA